jgi:hypothetical protein
VNYMGADLHQKIVRFVDIGTLTSAKTVVMQSD